MRNLEVLIWLGVVAIALVCFYFYDKKNPAINFRVKLRRNIDYIIIIFGILILTAVILKRI